MSEKEKKAKKEYKDRLAKRRAEAATEGAAGSLLGSAAAATDPFLSRNEFKEGFYDQKDKPPITPATMYGTASGKTMFESPIVDPDTSMMQNMAKGGFIAKGCGKVMGDRRKVTKMY